METVKPYVLLVGYRQQLAQALHQLNIPYSIWSEKKLLARPKGVDKIYVSLIPKQKEALLAALKDFQFSKVPTHVITGTESAVFPSAMIRRAFEARSSSQSLLIRCTDKVAMKVFLRRYGIPMTDFVVGTEALSAREIIDHLHLPVVVKNRRDSGSRNIVIAQDEASLSESMGRQRIYESFVQAPEGSVESFVQNSEIIFTNITEYYEKKFINLIPATYAPRLAKEILTLNQLVIKALNIKWGMTHLEFYRSSQGILFGEIALRPPGGYIMELLKMSYQFDPWDAFIKVELGMNVDLPAAPKFTSACQILHPGEGQVRKLKRPESKDFPTLKKAKIKIAIGSWIQERQGVGEDVGYFLFSSKSSQEVVRDIEKIKQKPTFILDKVQQGVT
ncbi:MAG: ATP-grasp domain-containing protein [Oligoflexus sp.]